MEDMGSQGAWGWPPLEKKPEKGFDRPQRPGQGKLGGQGAPVCKYPRRGAWFVVQI